MARSRSSRSSTVGDQQRFANEDLVLKVREGANRAVWDEDRYAAFFDALCGGREYQKEALRSALRFLLGGEYADLRALARENFDASEFLRARWGSWDAFEAALPLPQMLSATLDLATGTGKSYLLYGLAAVVLSEGAADRVLVLCPSTTIERELISKFKELAFDPELRDLLPADAVIPNPTIINGDESIVAGSICVENYHATLENVGSSIRQSLAGKGAHTLVLNDEAHHVVNNTGEIRKWKEFLCDAAFGFTRVIGTTGTPYMGNEYFSDVIHRYPLLQAMEERQVKRIEYIVEQPAVGEEDDLKWQLVRNRHNDWKTKLAKRGILPLTIIVTPTIARCKEVAQQLGAFLRSVEGWDENEASQRILSVYSGASDVYRLPGVDSSASKVEWIVSVSMLTEGWDVKRVFQIVPDQKRAFDSKLLIAQVLGRGLRVPLGWDWSAGEPTVTIFNHDAWAAGIRTLVDEVTEVSKSLTARVDANSPHHFTVHRLDYTLNPISQSKDAGDPLAALARGLIDLPTDIAQTETAATLERAGTGAQYRWQTAVTRRTFSADEVAGRMYGALLDNYDPDSNDPNHTYDYTKDYPLQKLKEIVTLSLGRAGMSVATDKTLQLCLKSLGTLRRTKVEVVRFDSKIGEIVSISTTSRRAESVSATGLRGNKSIYFSDQTEAFLDPAQREFFREVTDEESNYRKKRITNYHDWKTPVPLGIADSQPERDFLRQLIDPTVLPLYKAWLKSTSTGFYTVEFHWKKGHLPRKGNFNPDFFIQASDELILVIEIKDEKQVSDPSDENRAKSAFAREHFVQLNALLKEEGESVRYKFNFLTPDDFSTYFQSLKDGTIESFRSALDVALEKPV